MKDSLHNIRKEFLDFFGKNNHKIVPSSSLIPHNDPTMMFVNSGMVQFKNIFTGIEKRDYTRATSSQKSVRAGGKHNDLENVGYTARHHTFFEMLGNFSFGDYFKEDAIKYAYDFLTKNLGLNKEKLYITIYHNDDEAFDLWKKISGFSDDKIIRIATKDNFWSMGDTGPCGPCSEIFYDHGDHIFGGLPGTKDQDGDRFIEIWNLVFMQYEQFKDGSMRDLPNKSIDTGMGLERIAAVMQNVHDNYDIDLFKELIAESVDLTKTKYEKDALFSHRVIADHLRSASFLIADGVMPSNEGRGYVLRRIMRRAMRHAHQLGSKDALLYRLFPKLVQLMGDHYTELKRAEKFITGILRQEEERFKLTLDRGLKILDEESLQLSEGDKLSGEVAFKLYDTYGFPLDLTEDILKKKKISVDNEAFTLAMDEQKRRARENWSGSGEDKTSDIWFDIKDKFGTTEFLGYSSSKSDAQILAIVKNAKIIDKYDGNEEFIIISNQTPFYGESGGQMGDIGSIYSDEFRAEVFDTKKILGSIIAHYCKLKSGAIRIDSNAHFKINETYRNKLRANHSATHLLHAALRKILGEHVTQKGSLVASDRLRFDISHPSSITHEQIIAIEDMVNQKIIENTPVHTELMDTEEAIEKGAMALFGEKYDCEVRVVSMGFDSDDSSAANNYSFELCGGTHVNRTGDIGLFKILSESAIASGVRRIEAITSTDIISYIRNFENLSSDLQEMLKTSKSEIKEKVTNLLSDKKELEKNLSKLLLDKIKLDEEDIVKNSKNIGDIRILYKYFEEIDPKLMRNVVSEMSQNMNNQIIIYISKNADKLMIFSSVSQNLSSKFAANDIISYISEYLGGSKGGGNNLLAQSAAPYSNKVMDVEGKIVLHIESNL